MNNYSATLTERAMNAGILETDNDTLHLEARASGKRHAVAIERNDGFNSVYQLSIYEPGWSLPTTNPKTGLSVKHREIRCVNSMIFGHREAMIEWLIDCYPETLVYWVDGYPEVGE